MSSKYSYPVNECDVPEVRKKSLNEYRAFRQKCLEYLVGDNETSVMIQVHNLAWYTVVFRTLNEARRIEPEQKMNGALWELVTAGYSGLLTLAFESLWIKTQELTLCGMQSILLKNAPNCLPEKNLSAMTAFHTIGSWLRKHTTKN